MEDNNLSQAFRMAAGSGNLTYMKDYLGKCGAGAIDIPGPNGETALHRAVSARKVNVAEFLLENGANVNARERDGDTPLILALRMDGAGWMISLLLRFNASTLAANNAGWRPVDCLKDETIDGPIRKMVLEKSRWETGNGFHTATTAPIVLEMPALSFKRHRGKGRAP